MPRSHSARFLVLSFATAGVEPDVWKMEGLNERNDAEMVVATARRGGRDHVGCIVLGRGSEEQAVLRWLKPLHVELRPLPGSLHTTVNAV